MNSNQTKPNQTKEIHTFSRGISPKASVVVPLDFELVKCYVAVQLVSHITILLFSQILLMLTWNKHNNSL